MKKIIKNEDLRNVTGGKDEKDERINCPNCGYLDDHHTVTKGEGCDAKFYFVCSQCGHEWR